MALFGLFRRAAKADRSQGVGQSAIPTYVSPRYTDFKAYLRAYKEVPWIRPCVSVIAFNAANVGYRLVTINDAGEEEEIQGSPFGALLRRPNPFQTGFELMELAWTDLELTGNAFLSLEQMDYRGIPSELYRLSPELVTVVPDPRERVGGYRFTRNGRSVDYAPEEMLHLRYPNPLDELYGMGTIEAAEQRADSARAMAEHERGFWRSGAKITGVMQTDQAVDEGTFKRLSDNIRSFFRGAGYSTLLLEAGLKYQSVSDSPSKLGLLEMSTASRNEILAAFGVPPTKVGILENANYKAQNADEFFWCSVAGTPITVRDRGAVPVEEIAAGDLLLTHEGRWRPVTEARSRSYYGRLYRIALAKHSEALEFSEEHPFLVRRAGRDAWVRAGDLRVGDLVLGPRLRPEHAAIPVRTVTTNARSGSHAARSWDVSITPEIAWLAGLYVAEGHAAAAGRPAPGRAPGRPRGATRATWTAGVEAQSVVLTLNATRGDLIGRAATALATFGACSVAAPQGGAVRVRGCKAAASLLTDCGALSREKRIPAWMLEAPDDVLSAFLAGYWAGDGRADDRYGMSATTASERLAHDLALAFARLGAVLEVTRIPAAMQQRANGPAVAVAEYFTLRLSGASASAGRRISGGPDYLRPPRGRDPGACQVLDARSVAYRIEGITARRATGERIYNMEVAEDHSYTAGGVLAHNSETVAPRLTRMEQAFQPLVDRFHPGQEVRMRFERLNFADDLPTATVAHLMRQTESYTIDEIRAYRGDPPLPNAAGASILVGQGVAPVLLDTAAPPPVGSAAKRLGSQRRPAVAHLLARRRDTVERHAVARYGPRLGEAFAAQERRVLAALERTKRRKAALRVDDVWSDDDEDAALGPVLGLLHDDALDAAYGSAAAAGLDVSFDVTNPRLADVRGTLAGRVRGINQTTRDALDATISDGLQKGYSTKQIADGVPDDDYGGVTGVFAQAKGYRAELISRTESLHAYGQASILAYQDSGVVDRVELLDGTGDPECAARNGLVVSLDEAQGYLADEHPQGTLALVPLVGGEA